MPSHITRRTALLFLILAAGLLWPAPIAAAPSAPHTGPTPSNTCLIYSLYLDLLGRKADSGGLAAGLTYLGSHTRQAYADTLLTGDAYRTVLIQALYKRYLDRPATGIEVSAGLTIFGIAGKDEDIIAIIVGSDEYFNLARVGGDNVNFIKAIYRDLLGRPAQPADIGGGLGYLGGHTRQQYAALILSSTEYRAVIIKAWYQQYLGRNATSGELSAWQSSLSGGATDEDVIANVLGSLEYFNRAGLCTTYLPLVRR